jgi:predicted N-acetyltransferase YhbS
VIRSERDDDRAAVRAVELAAFGQDVEADIVDALRDDPAWALSLVAEVDGEIVGHLLFSRGSRGVMTLGPLAVRPSHQRRGIGSALMREGWRGSTVRSCYSATPTTTRASASSRRSRAGSRTSGASKGPNG